MRWFAKGGSDLFTSSRSPEVIREGKELADLVADLVELADLVEDNDRIWPRRIRAERG